MYPLGTTIAVVAGALSVALVAVLYIVSDTDISFVASVLYLNVPFIVLLYIAYNVTLLVPIFKLESFALAVLDVFHPTNVHPAFVAVGVKSIALPYATVAVSFVAFVPPFVL